jgi:flagellar basal body-associated protein FliL
MEASLLILSILCGLALAFVGVMGLLVWVFSEAAKTKEFIDNNCGSLENYGEESEDEKV